MKVNKKDEKQVIDPVVQRILTRLDENGQTQKELVEYLGLGNGIFTRWKYDDVRTYMMYIDEIAEFLNVSSIYLMYGDDYSSPDSFFSNDEKKLIELYRKMNQEQKDTLFQVANVFINHSL